MPLARGGSNWISNIALACPTCNKRKGAKHPIDWAQQNGRLL
jgi:5-methylcytosine-specific restriction endonuclease McrA